MTNVSTSTSCETGTSTKPETEGDREGQKASAGGDNGELKSTTTEGVENVTTEEIDDITEAFRPTVIAAATYNNSAWHQWYEKYGQYYFANVYYNQHQPYHHYPGSVSDNPLAPTLQRPTVQPGQTPQTVREDDSSDFKCIADYGYPPPPKPPALPVPSPLVSPLASDEEDFDDENLIDLDAEIEDEIAGIDALHIHGENLGSEVRPPSPVILEPPPAPPKFPFIVPPKISFLPPPPLRSIPLVPPLPKRGDKYAEFRNQEEELPWMIDGVHPALPKGLLSLMKPMLCRLCNIELSSKVVSLDHYRGRKHRLNVNFWLKRNKLPLAVSYPLPVSYRQQQRLDRVRVAQPPVPPMQPPPPSRRPLLPTPRIVPRSLEHPTFLWRDMSDPSLPDAVRNLCGYMKCGVCDVHHFSATHGNEHYKSALHRLMVDKWLERHHFVPNVLHRPVPRTANLPPRSALPMPRSRVYHPPSAPFSKPIIESTLEVVDIADSPPSSPPQGSALLPASKPATSGLLKVPSGLRSYWAWIKKNKVGFFAQRTVRPSRFTSLPRTNTMTKTKTVRVLKPRPYYEAPIFKLKRVEKD